MNISRTDSKSTSGPNRWAGVGTTVSAAKQPVGQTASDPAASDSAASDPAASDKVQLSNLSGYLASALAGSPAHVAKVGELSAAVSSGKYQVDANAVSGSIIQHSIEFGGASYPAVNT
jgi:flagellar biosynthesis anti-sigma factor FlgM